VLTVGIEHIPCSADPTGETSAFGDIKPGLFCYPSPPQVPDGAGTMCETPTGQLTGWFTRTTLDA